MEHKRRKLSTDEMKAYIGDATETNDDINEEIARRYTDDKIKEDIIIDDALAFDLDSTELIAELDTFVKNLNYPTNKQDIIDIAMREGSDSKITDALQTIPDKYYSSADELNSEISSFG